MQRLLTGLRGSSLWTSSCVFFCFLVTVYFFTPTMGESQSVRTDVRRLRDPKHASQFLDRHSKPVQKYDSQIIGNFFDAVSPTNVQELQQQYGRSNLIFVHQNKAAGSTVKAMLEARCTAHSQNTA